MEAVKQGSTVVACGNTKNVVLAALKRKQSQLSSVQEKIFAINSQGGVAISGLSTDGARLVKLLRDESVREEFVYDRVTTPSRLAVAVSDASQLTTQRSSSRPFGVGLVLVGKSANAECQIFQTCPSGILCQMRCTAIGARAQSARTFFERHIEDLSNANLDELITMVLKALSETCLDGKLSADGCEVATLGENPFAIKSTVEIEEFLKLL